MLNINDPTTRVNVITNSGTDYSDVLAANIYYNSEDEIKEGITTTLMMKNFT